MSSYWSKIEFIGAVTVTSNFDFLQAHLYCKSGLYFVKVTANLFGLEFCKILKSHHKIAPYIYLVQILRSLAKMIVGCRCTKVCRAF